MSSKERKVLQLVLLLLENELDWREKERLSRMAGASKTGASKTVGIEKGGTENATSQDTTAELSSDRKLLIEEIQKLAAQDAAVVLPLMKALQSLRRG